jgi:hypothetical protein
MGMKADPLIFLHIGDIFYLKYTLRSAVFHNPNTEVILIGDRYNKKYEHLGVKHFNFHGYLDTDDIKEFDQVYKLIGGTRFIEINRSKGYDWTKYNFLKWFVLRNFLRQHNYTSCWTFDSDNMLLCDLNSKDYFFQNLDCTVRPAFSMIMGKINNTGVLEDYCKVIIDLFKNSTFLNKQKEEFLKEPKFGYTMMRAFMEFYLAFKHKYAIDTLEKEIDNELFLDIILRTAPSKYELSGKKECDKSVLLLKNDGNNIFVQQTGSIENIRLNSVDLSWVPEYYFKKILKTTSARAHKNIVKNPEPLEIKKTIEYTMRNNFYKLRKWLRIIHL